MGKQTENEMEAEGSQACVTTAAGVGSKASKRAWKLLCGV